LTSRTTHEPRPGVTVDNSVLLYSLGARLSPRIMRRTGQLHLVVWSPTVEGRAAISTVSLCGFMNYPGEKTSPVYLRCLYAIFILNPLE